VLTSHDAFGYFGRAYGVTFLAPQGLSSESEASAAQVAALIKQIKADGVHTWFMENQLDPRLVKQIASATGAQPGENSIRKRSRNRAAWRIATSKCCVITSS
jgi:zinc/manganese transport system substrate-binding protein